MYEAAKRTLSLEENPRSSVDTVQEYQPANTSEAWSAGLGQQRQCSVADVHVEVLCLQHQCAQARPLFRRTVLTMRELAA